VPNDVLTMTPRDPELLVLVVAPSGRDAELVCQVLKTAGILCEPCPSIEDACAHLLHSVGAIIAAEEALNAERVKQLAEMIAEQPTWSDFPLLLLTVPGQVSEFSQKRSALREPLGNVLLLERPVRPETLISTVRIALRARRRQYQIRDQLKQRKLAEDALRRSEKLAVAGRLSATIAHEINNPLEAVTNLLYLIETSDSIEAIHKYVKMAEEELARVSEIASHTLSFHRQPLNPVMVKLPDVVESVLTLYRQRLNSSGVKIEREYGEVPDILAMPGELRQLIANLVGNAADAMRFGGRLRIRVKPSRSADGRSGVCLTVADTGSGIAAEHRQHIFEPFFSTKGNTGTGLGLWVSASIVEKHGGSMRVRSTDKEGRSGTIFSVFLPSEHHAGEQLTFAAAENIA
jgi:signal transduction histidine kinase